MLCSFRSFPLPLFLSPQIFCGFKNTLNRFGLRVELKCTLKNPIRYALSNGVKGKEKKLLHC